MSEFCMPSLGSDMEAGTLVEWMVHPGSSVKRGDIIAVVETQKGAIEIEIFEDGVVQEILVPEGCLVPVGTVLALVGSESATVFEPEVSQTEPTPKLSVDLPADLPSEEKSVVEPLPKVVPLPPADLSDTVRLRVSPLARRKARELGLELSQWAHLTGTGPGGAISVRDIETHQAQKKTAPALPPHAGPAARQKALELGVSLEHLSGSGPHGLIIPEDVKTESKPPQDPMRAAIAAAMSRSKREIPHYYLGHTLDMEPALAWLEAFNQERPITERLVYAVVLVKAVSLALRKFQEFNGFYTDGVFRPAEQIDVGVAISLRTGGLVAPALKNVDQKSLVDLMTDFRDLVNRARSGQLRASEMKGGGITVTNLGEQGVEFIYPVIYPPQVAMVGFGTLLERPWVVDGEVKPRRVLSVSLAGDHRVSDGHRGAMFLARLEKLLRKPEKL